MSGTEIKTRLEWIAKEYSKLLKDKDKEAIKIAVEAIDGLDKVLEEIEYEAQGSDWISIDTVRDIINEQLSVEEEK